MARRRAEEVNRQYWTEEEGLVEVKELVEKGVGDKEIAAFIGITPKTLYDWKKKYDTFSAVFNVGRKVVSIKLSNAGIKAGMGYYVNEQVLDSKGHKRVIRKWVPPNPTMNIFYQKVYGKMSDKIELDINNSLPVVLTGDDDIAD